MSTRNVEGNTHQIQLDWQAYFYSFLEKHGEPVSYVNTRLLFRDGWMYSSLNYQGPEYPPPKEKKYRHRLILVYWKRRKDILTQEYKQLVTMVSALEEWQQTRELPLQHRLIYESRGDDGATTLATSVEALDLAPHKRKAEDLRHLIDECEENLKGTEYDTKTDNSQPSN